MPETSRRIVLLPGDGIGPEVIAEAAQVLREAAASEEVRLDLVEHAVGGAAIDRDGAPLPKPTLAAARGADAVLLGAVGSPRHDRLPRDQRPEQALLGLRQELGVFANLRPVRLHPALIGASPLRPEIVGGTDLVIVRELTGGLYFGTPRGLEGTGEGRRARNTMTYSAGEIRRIARVAFETARGRKRQVTSVDKANILETSQLWREVVIEVAKGYPDVTLDHMYVDACAMALVTRPARFDVILTENLFGDILSDEAAVIAGSIGLLPSASLGTGPGLYEPVHGSAPDIAGQDKANPLGTIASLALLFSHSLNLPDEAAAIEQAIGATLKGGDRTADLPGTTPPVGCREMGARVARRR